MNYFKKARKLFEEGKFDECLNYLDKVIESTPTDRRLRHFKESMHELIETEKMLGKIRKTKSELIKEADRLRKEGILD